MVVASFSPLFLLWAIRGTVLFEHGVFAAVLCLFGILLPNLFIYYRIRRARKNRDLYPLSVGMSEDGRDQILVYLIAILLPVYALGIDDFWNLIATFVALLIILVIFWLMNLQYLNLFFSFFGYRIFMLYPTDRADVIEGYDTLVLITRRSRVKAGECITALRISDTIYLEDAQRTD